MIKNSEKNEKRDGKYSPKKSIETKQKKTKEKKN